MKEPEYILPRFWSISVPVLYPAEQELENLNSAGTYLFTAKLRYWGLGSKCINSARFVLYDKNNKKIKGLSSNFLDFKDLRLGRSVKLSFLMELPRNVHCVKVEPILFEEACESWYDFILGVCGMLTIGFWLLFTALRIIF